jgi:thioredoxin reductase (NADPH)
VVEVLGEKKVEAVRLRNVQTGEEYEKRIGGMFLGIGHQPNTKAFTPWLPHDELGYLLPEPGRTRTTIPGVFACGDAADHYYRQAVTAAGSGCAAAIECERWLEEQASGSAGGHA